GFDGGTLVAGGSTTTHTFTDLDPTKQYYFRVVAVNEGGESPASQVVAATATDTARSLLIVNGFDRLTRALNPKEPLGFGSNTIDRVRPRQSNAGDYVVPVADSIGRVNPQITVASASNEAVIAGDVVLGDYDVVIWMSGEESTEDETFSPAEQTLVTSYVLAGGDLFASGAEIAWDLDAQNNGQTFFNNIFDAEYQADDANTYLASGVPGEMFAGISLEFDDGDKFYNVEFADVLTPGDNATSVMQYATGGAAGIFTPGLLGRGDVLLFGFPIESILDTADLDTVLSATLDEFAPSTEPEYTYDEAVDDFDPGPAFEKTSGWTLSVGGGSFDGTYLFGSAGGSSTATWQFEVEGYGQAQVLAWWVDGGNRADSVTYSVETAFGTTDLTADQTTSGGQWVSLGFVPVAAGITEVTLDAANATGGSLVVADAVRLVISNGQPASADFNDDLIVDVADFTLWRDQLGAAVTPGTGADATGDGLVSVADYQVWKDQFGTVITPPAMPLASVAPAPPAIKIEEQESRFAGPVDQSLQGQPAALRSASVASFTGPVSTRGQAPFNAYFASEEPFAVRSQAIESANLQLYFDSSFSPDAFRETTETSLEVELQAAAEDPSRAEPPTTLERDFDLAFEAFK
ncbi:MAG: fibronectin type III domain-containing protein, partial [Planctomycetota bacterium]